MAVRRVRIRRAPQTATRAARRRSTRADERRMLPGRALFGRASRGGGIGPPLVAACVGVASGFYIFNEPLKRRAAARTLERARDDEANARERR
jgi:hypothetical protein